MRIPTALAASQLRIWKRSLSLRNENIGEMPSTWDAQAKGPEPDMPSQLFDYFLVLDFEATCDLQQQPRPQEIIEWPTLKVNARTMETEAVFHRYIRPTFHPSLTPFCTQLTGIVQDQVDEASDFPTTLDAFHSWMVSEGLAPGEGEKEDGKPIQTSAFLTCGDWDLHRALRANAVLFPNLSLPNYFNSWINIKKAYCRASGVWPKSMVSMLEGAGLRLEGRHHSGIDDARNIARIAAFLVSQHQQTLRLTAKLDPLNAV